MQCRTCGSKWESKTEVSNCPFCGQSLQIAKKTEDMDIADVIAYIISMRGVEVLKNSKVITAYVMDFVHGYEYEKKLFRVLCNYDIFSGAYKICVTTDPVQRDIIIKRQYKILIEEAFLSEERATEALNLVLRGIGVEELKRNGSASPAPSNSTNSPSDTAVPKVTVNKPPQSVSAERTSPQKSRSYGSTNSVNTFNKYLKALEEYYVQLGKCPLTETQISLFLSVHSLDRVWGITVADVQKDLKGIYAKYTPEKPKPTVPATPQIVTSKKLFTPNKTLSTYKAYMYELELVFIRNGKVMLTSAQIDEFIQAYALGKNFGITAREVEADLREIMRKH